MNHNQINAQLQNWDACKYSQNLGDTIGLAGSPRAQCLLLRIFVQKVFETNVNFRCQIWKNKDPFAVSKVGMALFFLISYSLVPKIKICLEILFG